MAPSVSFAWCPNVKGEGYPWVGVSSVQEGTADYDLMDTNDDGIVNMEDNAFDPFWPGG